VSRSDDTEGVVRERLKVYWRDTRPMIQYYGARPTFRTIDGARTPEHVRDALIAAVSQVAAAIGLPRGSGANAAGDQGPAGSSAGKGVGA
jgi:hypothetical protein